jgi:cell division protein FtsB
MITNRRRRTVLTALMLYTMAALFIGYFAVNAFTGNHGLHAQHEFDRQIREMSSELARLRAERLYWQRRVALLRSNQIDPDMLDERARAILDFVSPNDAVAFIR